MLILKIKDSRAMAATKIEWAEASWNPVTGCDKISSGCMNCYAERMAFRLQTMGNPNYTKGFTVAPHPQLLNLPLAWRAPRVIFVNSMSDLFHKGVSDEFILQVFDIMGRASWHTFQILTKRSDRLKDLSPRLPWRDNIWMGVSVENRDCAFRIDDLRQCAASVKFLSCEPLLGPLGELDLENIDWLIVGGESGPGARPIRKDWVVSLRDQCVTKGIPFFFKQWGGTNKKKSGRSLEGRFWDETPTTASASPCCA
jgi:protein gp37